MVFLSVCRTASWLYDSANANSTTLPASKRNVQCSCPSGASLHATAIRCAHCRSPSFGLAPKCGPSFNARSSPASTNRCRTRPTVAYPTFNAAATASSVMSSSAFNRIRARVSVRDPCRPLPISPSRYSRSSFVKSTRYLIFMSIPRIERPKRRPHRLLPITKTPTALSINSSMTDY